MIWAIHGFTGSPVFWNESLALPPSRQLAILGHAPSCVAHGDESFASEVSRLADQLPTSDVHLVGYSLGARLALGMALADPSRLSKLSLIGVHPGLESEDERATRRESDQAWCRLLRTEGIRAFVDAWQDLPLWQSQRQLPEARLDSQRSQRLEHDPLQLAHALQSLGTGNMPPMWQALPSLSMPVQLIVGERDSKFAAIAEAMLAKIPDGRLQRVSGAGHNPVLENPSAIHRLISDFDAPARVAL